MNLYRSPQWQDMMRRIRLAYRIAEQYPNPHLDVNENWFIITTEQYVLTQYGVEVGYLPYSIKIPKQGDPVKNFKCVVHYKNIGNALRHWANIANYNATYFEEQHVDIIAETWEQINDQAQ